MNIEGRVTVREYDRMKIETDDKPKDMLMADWIIKQMHVKRYITNFMHERFHKAVLNWI